METNLFCCTRTGRTTSEKTMEDGNVVNTKDDKIATASLANLYSERSCKLTTNGHDFAGEPSNAQDKLFEVRRHSADTLQEDKFRKRINPLRIHLGKRPFVDNSVPYNSVNKKRKPFVNKPSEVITPKSTAPRVPKLIPTRLDRSQYHNVNPQMDNVLDNEQDKPVPRLVPKSQLLQYKKSKMEKGTQLKEYAQKLGLQPMVKFKCRKCCSMSFKTLAMLKEHQHVCRAQAKEPALSPESASNAECNTGGPSRVTRKVYLCSACCTYYENWNLFLHMREVHNRHICLICLGMFSKAEKLSSHLTNKHNVQEFSYDSKEEFCSVYNGTFYLMCCVCDEICSEKDDFFNHDCNNIKPKPVPVLVSKNLIKSKTSKYSKTGNEAISNGPATMLKDVIKSVDKKEIIEPIPETITSQSQRLETNISNSEIVNSDTSTSSENSTSTIKDTSSTLDSTLGMDISNTKPYSSPVYSSSNIESSTGNVPNGNEQLEQSDESDSLDTDDHHNSPPSDYTVIRPKESLPPPQQPFEKEREGIKLKLSLNNANSPVIINSTVDPTVGQQYANKPPSRNRRPPKRYEKDKTPDTAPVIKPPSIKMTICDKADSPFVKTTIIENNKETTVKTLVNNNVEIIKTPEFKSENTIKSTIYDNKLEEVNTLNRVPKLTVRVPKEFLDKNSSSDYSSDSDIDDKLTVMEDFDKEIQQTCENKEESSYFPTANSPQIEPHGDEDIKYNSEQVEEKVQINDEIIAKLEPKTEPEDQSSTEDINVEEPIDPVESDDIPVTELTLDRPIDKYPLKDLLKVFLSSTVFNCIYCNHVRKIAVNCEQLALHMVAQHRFCATVDSITAEELMPETITAKVKAGAVELSSIYINLDSYDSVDKCETVQNIQMFECFQCYFKTAVHKDLYLHNRKMHQKTILLCVMCKNNFYSYSELLCHLCPGTYDSEYVIKFRCCFCNVDNISSSFRLMVHLRKIHHTCDVCLEFCQSQARLSNHVWKHKLHHLCYRCGIAYRNKLDITNHLFWKHGTESVLCKKCLQKKWPHVYHFCTPPAVFVCDECTLQFTRAVCLKVHKRFHLEEYPHVCTEDECTEKFVSKKLLNKHLDSHRKKLLTEDLNEEKKPDDSNTENTNEPIPVIDLLDEKPKEGAGSSDIKAEAGTEKITKRSKKKKNKDKDALLLDVNLPALNLSESDSSDESDSAVSQPNKDEISQDKLKDEIADEKQKLDIEKDSSAMDVDMPSLKVEQSSESLVEEKPSEQQVLDIWDNFKKYQAKVEKQKEKTPPLVPIRKHVCDSDHDYCLIPTDLNGEDDIYHSEKKKNKKSPKKRHDGNLSSSSSSSSDSDSSCSCRSNCSCSSSSGSSSSSSSDSDSSDESGNEKKKNKQQKKSLPNRRISNGSNVDVMGMSETPILIPEKTEPPIAESDLETEESETDEEFYDEHPQKIANKMYNEKRNQLMLLASVAPSDGGSISGDVSRSNTPIKEEQKEPKAEKVEKVGKVEKEDKQVKEGSESKEKPSSSKKKSKKKKKSKSSRKHGPIKMTIPKDVIASSETGSPLPLIPNKITISLQSNTVQLPEVPKTVAVPPPASAKTVTTSTEKKRASKRRRVPNKFYGYSSDEDAPQGIAALKPQQPPKLEWRKEDLPSPVTHKSKKEIPSTVIPQRMFNYNESIRLTTPIPDPEPPRFLMNSESMESSDSESSNDGALEILQSNSAATPAPLPPPTYLNSGTSSLPYAFQRPSVRQAREGESVYCYCRCPYDEVSEMIACDAEGCTIEWFHFECVGIMVPPKGKWYCPECRKNQSFSGYR